MQQIYELGELFTRVQMEQIFHDSKTFVDCIPKKPLAYIQDVYQKAKEHPEFSLKEFVYQYFLLPGEANTDFITVSRVGIAEHIHRLWDHLTRQTGDENQGSLIALPYPYVVPGGRFRELFYWDSYFTMLGLAISERYDLIENMLENFAFMIDQFGYIPNGNRSYFLGRSQPPFFSLMVELLAAHSGDQIRQKFFGPLKMEYAFWMGQTPPEETWTAAGHLVHLEKGALLNRYFDRSDKARPEAYRKDMEWLREAHDKQQFFMHERAACESGWDFSSRWFVDGDTIAYTRCADLLPVDLNCLLYHLELTLATCANDPVEKERYATAAALRKASVQKYFWNDEHHFFFDFNFRKRQQSAEWTLAAVFPLYFGICTEAQAASVADRIKTRFLAPGGLLTTLRVTGQQWDAPNGWAPLQWMAVKGLSRYGFNDLAAEIARRWLQKNETIYKETGKLMEKYNVQDAGGQAIAGTYPTQDGFGWTNGVYLACKQFLDRISAHAG